MWCHIRHGGKNKCINNKQMKEKWWSVLYRFSRRAKTRREGEKLRREGESLISISNGFARFIKVDEYETWQEALTAATDRLRGTTVATDKATISLCTRRGDGAGRSLDIAGELTKTHTAGVGWSVTVRVFEDVDYNAR